MAIPCYSREIAASLVHMVIDGADDESLRTALIARGVEQSQHETYIGVARTQSIETHHGKHAALVDDKSRGFMWFINRVLRREKK